MLYTINFLLVASLEKTFYLITLIVL